MPHTIIFLFEKFLQKTLNYQEKQLFAKLLHSKESQKELSTYQLAKEVITSNAENRFRNLLDEIAFEYEYKSKLSMGELQELFKPSDKYEKYLSQQDEMTNIYVRNPQNGSNQSSELQFELSTFMSHQMLLRLFNNRNQQVFQQLIPPKIIYFDVPLNHQFLPGRYYWTLNVERQKPPIVGMFYVGKDLV